METKDYAQSLKFNCGKFREVDLVIMALFFDIKLTVYIINWATLSTQIFNSSTQSQKALELFLDCNGNYHIVLPKSKAKTIGICQSIVLDVSSF